MQNPTYLLVFWQILDVDSILFPQVKRRSHRKEPQSERKPPRPVASAARGEAPPSNPLGDDQEELDFMFDEEMEKLGGGGRQKQFTEYW